VDSTFTSVLGPALSPILHSLYTPPTNTSGRGGGSYLHTPYHTTIVHHLPTHLHHHTTHGSASYMLCLLTCAISFFSVSYIYLTITDCGFFCCDDILSWTIPYAWRFTCNNIQIPAMHNYDHALLLYIPFTIPRPLLYRLPPALLEVVYTFCYTAVYYRTADNISPLAWFCIFSCHAAYITP